jgi:hypothetical protein
VSGKIGILAFVSSNSENISRVAFLKHKNSRNRELALWHLVNRLVLKIHKNATKCNRTQSKWCINKHGASKIIDTFESYQASIPAHLLFSGCQNMGAMEKFTSHGSDRVEGFSFGSFLGASIGSSCGFLFQYKNIRPMEETAVAAARSTFDRKKR